MSERSAVSKVVKDVEVDHTGTPQSFLHLTKNMENELEKRKSNWEDEVSKMQADFFNMKGLSSGKNGQKEIGAGKTKVVEMKTDSNVPKRRPGSGAVIFDISHAKTLYSDQPDGTKLFKLRFDVKGYEPHEIAIKVEGQKLIVTAKTEEESQTGDKATKQFNRQVDIPKSVDPDKLTSLLSSDGILSIEAPVEYEEEDEEDELYSEEAMLAHGGHPGIEPPQYRQVIEGGGGGGDGVEEGYTGGYSITSRVQRDPGPPVASDFSFQSTRGLGGLGGGLGGGGGYSHRSYSSNSQPAFVPHSRTSYEFHSCHHGPGHHDCHHKGGPRRHLETYEKRVKNPPPKVDYFKAVSPSLYHGAAPGLTGSALASSIIQPSSGSNYTVRTSSSSSSSRQPRSHGGGGGGGNYTVTSSSSSSNARSPTTVISEHHSYRHNDPRIIGSEEEGGKRLKLVVDVGKDFGPEDVHVTLHDSRRIAVQARCNLTVSGRTKKREFTRDFHSPEDLESYTARASLDSDAGKLYIGACVVGNPDQDTAMQHVLGDIPNSATACNLSLE